MKRATFIVFVLVMVLATCKAPETKAPDVLPADTTVPALDTALPPTPTETSVPQGKLPAAPFDAETYINEEAGFALDYPSGWTVNETVVGERGTQVQFLSSPDLAESDSLPAGSTRVTAVLYQWDPKNDLAAYVDQQKTAWEASGFSILEEQQLTLELGLPAVLFKVQSPEGPVLFLITALKDRYLVISGAGDLELAQQIMQRLRPVSS